MHRPASFVVRALRAASVVLAASSAAAPAALRAQISVLGHTVQEHASAPGQMHTGTVLVANAGAEPQTVRLYLTDYTFDAAGETRYDPPATRPRSNAAWVTLEGAQTTIPAGTTVPVRYTVRTPARLLAGGTFWSLLMVEPTSRQASGPGSGQMALTTSVRYGVQVVNHVSLAAATADAAGGAAPAAPVPNAEISAPRAAGAAGTLVVEFDLRNTGDLGYRPELSLELVDAAGRSIGTFRQRRGLLYPGTSLRQRFECPGVARGNYRAVIVADTGEDVFGTQLAVTW